MKKKWLRGIGRGLIAALTIGLPVLAAGSGANWTVGGANLHNTRHAATETKIGPENVADLVPKWVFTAHGDISATPTVEGKALYVVDWGGYLHKIDRQSGQAVWSRHVGGYSGNPASVSRTSPAIDGDRLFLGLQDGGLVLAVNKQTGDLLWSTQIESHPLTYITQSPVVFRGTVYVGASSAEEGAATDPDYPCCSFRGSMAALDAATGALLWKTYTVPEGYSGGGVWSSTPAIDAKRGQLYISTGNNYSVPDEVEACVQEKGIENASECLAPDDYFDAVIALDLTTGAVRWGTRVEGYDAWTVACFFLPPGVTWCPSPEGPDYDFGAGPNLFTVQGEHGKPRDLVGTGQKSGIYWAFDPDTGAIVWNTLVGPGSALGGVEWGTATDGERIYVAISNFENKPYTLTPSGDPAEAGSWAALDAATGEILWQTADPLGSFDIGAVSVANGVVYAGSKDPAGHMYAQTPASRANHWHYAAGGTLNPGPAIVNGTVYWGSGYSRFGLGTGGNKLYAFALPK